MFRLIESEEWKPIATAPRDGTVIVGRSDKRRKLTFWDRDVGAFVLVYDGPLKSEGMGAVLVDHAVREKIAPVIETFDPIEWKVAPDWQGI